MALATHKRLQTIHDDFYTKDGNLVVADIKFKIQTTSNKSIVASFPIIVDDIYLYNISKIDKENFARFYRKYKRVNGKISALPHYHSEAFLFYYLNSKKAKNYIIHYLKDIKGITPQNSTIIYAELDIYTTHSMCSSCQKLAQGTDSNDGFIEKFEKDIINILEEKGFDVNYNFYLELCPSYESKYKDRQTLTHIHPSDLNQVNIRKSPMDCLKINGEFDFKNPTHTLFSSGGTDDKQNKKYTNEPRTKQNGELYKNDTRGTIYNYKNSVDAVNLEEYANESATKIQRCFKITKNLKELPQGFFSAKEVLQDKKERQIKNAFQNLPLGL